MKEFTSNSLSVSTYPEKLASVEQEKIATDNFAIWNKALLTKNPQAVADLYADDATFLPTVSPDYKQGKKGAFDYMEHFLQKAPEGTILSAKTIFLNDNCYAHVGKYNFAVGPTGKRENVAADFMYVWQNNKKDDWGIIHHHSAAVTDQVTIDFLQKNPQGEKIIEKEQVIDNDHLLVSGLYKIKNNGKEVMARFTRILVKENNDWRILQQQLSLLPGSKI